VEGTTVGVGEDALVEVRHEAHFVAVHYNYFKKKQFKNMGKKSKQEN
jgi:hypothetical protein